MHVYNTYFQKIIRLVTKILHLRAGITKRSIPLDLWLEALFLSGMARLLSVPDEVLLEILPPPRSIVFTFSGSLFNDYKGEREKLDFNVT